MRSGPLTGTLSLLFCLNHRQPRLIDVTLIKPSKSLYFRSVLLRRSNDFGLAFLDGFDCSIYENKFPTRVIFLFPFEFCLLRSEPFFFL